MRDPQTEQVLSTHQVSILDHLDTVQPTSLGMLAEPMGVTASTMSLNVDRLERQGYVIRTSDIEDKRRVNVRLSAAGQRLRDAKTVLDAARVRASLINLTEQERDEIVAGLTLLMQAAQQMMHDQASGMPG